LQRCQGPGRRVAAAAPVLKKNPPRIEIGERQGPAALAQQTAALGLKTGGKKWGIALQTTMVKYGRKKIGKKGAKTVGYTFQTFFFFFFFFLG
jgi:hypothetical protein